MKILVSTFVSFLFLTGFSQTTPVFEDGQAQIVKEFSNKENWIRHDLWVETDFNTDGDATNDRMHVSVTRPQQTESEGLKLPVIYVTSPYFAGVAGNVDGLFWDVKHELGELPKTERVHPEVQRRSRRPIISNSHITKWVPRGYIVVHSSSPGTGLSDGAPTVGGPNESLAPKAVIEWLCGKRKAYTSRKGNEEVTAYWSTGKVGMTGTSYNGTLPLAAATTGVDGLEAIIPIAPNTSYYHYYRSHGLVRSPGGYLGEDVDVLYDFIHSGDESKRAYNNQTVRDTEMKNGMDRITGDYNEFWAGRDYLNQMSNMKAALLMSHGFNDWNVMPEHSYRIYKAAKDMGLPAMIYYHQNGHGGPPPMELMNRWFTKYLHGVDNGIEKATHKSYIVRENENQKNPTAYKDYPHPNAAMVTFSLSGDGNSNGNLTLGPAPATTANFVDNVAFSGKELASSKQSNHRLLFLTKPLSQDVHVSGVPEIEIRLASSKKAANLSVWLVSLPWEEGKNIPITHNIITRGWADPQNHQSIDRSEPLEPGKFYSLKFTLQPDDQVLRKGQQLGLMLFSSDQEFTLHPKPGTEITVDLRKTLLHLPVVDGVKGLGEF